MSKLNYIDKFKVSDLVAFEKNAKLHPQTQIDQIIHSIEQFGFNDPIAVDEDNVIIEGHGRLLAAKEMDLKTVPVIKLTGLSESKKRAYILAHNKLCLNSGFDKTLLGEELNFLKEEDFNLDLLGFDDYVPEISSEEEGVVSEETDTETPAERNSIIQYNIIFENESQRDRFYKFIREIKNQYPDQETISGRIDEFLKGVPWVG